MRQAGNHYFSCSKVVWDGIYFAEGRYDMGINK